MAGSAPSNEIVLYEPRDFDEIMKDQSEITLSDVTIHNPPQWAVQLHEKIASAYDAIRQHGTSVVPTQVEQVKALREHYTAMVEDYTMVKRLLRSQMQLTTTQVEVLELQFNKAYNTFTGEVWTQIARFSNEQQARDNAIYRLKDIAQHHEGAINVLHAELVKQKATYQQVEEWAKQKNGEVAYLLQREQEGTISGQEQSRMSELRSFATAAVEEALKQRETGPMDMETVLGNLADRARNTGSLEPEPVKKSRHVKKSTSTHDKPPNLTDEFLRRAATREVKKNADRQLAGQRSMEPAMMGGLGGGKPPPPPKGRENPEDPEEPDSSSSSESTPSDEDDFVIPVRRSAKRSRQHKTRRESSEDIVALLGAALRTGGGPTISMNKPERYNGKDKTKFLSWWQSVESYMEVHTRNFETDAQKIGWIGSLFTDTALEWHQKRVYQVAKLGFNDQWANYVTALRERFRDVAREHNDLKAMRKLEYKGDIAEYITKLQELNYSVNWSGISFRNHVAQTVPKKIVELVYSRQGAVPSDDEPFLDAVTEAGLLYETMQADPGLHRDNKTSGKEESTSKKEHSKSDQPGKDSRSRSDQSSKRKRDEEKSDEQNPKEKKWPNNQAALKGIKQAQIDKFKANQATCWRCGRFSHRSTECYAATDADGNTIPLPENKVASTTVKTEESEDKEEEVPHAKRQKIAGLLDHHSIPFPWPRIVELSDSEDQEGF